MKIALDAMGGDYAPEATVMGAIVASSILPENVKIVLIGDKEKILEITSRENFDHSVFDIVHADEVITMGDHPAKAFSKKTKSSIVTGFGMLTSGKVDAFASCGNTGAMMVGAMFMVKSIPGVIRPCISAQVPNIAGGSSTLLDVGINPDCRPDVLYQYGILGSLYAQYVFHIDKPKVCLLNLGSEEEKGNLITKATHELMKGSQDFNFAGNIEGNELFNEGKSDVIVCEGFVGNVILKEAEAFYTLLKRRKIDDDYFERFNFENYGGTPILGINQPVIIGHGISNSTAIKNLLIHAKDVVEAGLIDKFKEAFR
ncbi:MAG: phosphate acyltransferase PlsX [Bacteroidales bacterium]